MPKFLTANISPEGLRDNTAEKSHVLKPYGIVGQLRYKKRKAVYKRTPDCPVKSEQSGVLDVVNGKPERTVFQSRLFRCETEVVSSTNRENIR